MVGVFTFQWFDVGLVAVSSPGSIFLLIGLAPKEDMLFILLGVIFSAFISFISSFLLLKSVADSPTVQENQETIINFYDLAKDEMPRNSVVVEDKSYRGNVNVGLEESLIDAGGITTILFVCEAGIGSSAMGAAMLRKKLEQANLKIAVENSAVNEIPENADLIICHQKLLSTVHRVVPNKVCYPLRTFTDMKVYDQLVNKLKRII